MLFVAYAHDAPNVEALREEHYEAHAAYLSTAGKHNVTVIMSGPLVRDDEATPVGSLLVLDAPDRKTVENFHHADPFHINGIWEKSTVTAFLKKRG